METIEFKNRNSLNPNRRKIKIINQVGNEMLADIEMADSPIEEGTAITAEILTKWQETIVQNETKSNNAESNSNIALETSDTAKSNSETAISTADTALSTANEAKTIAQNAHDRVVEGLGTKVSVNGVDQANWSSDLKLDKAQGVDNAKKTLVVNDDGNVALSDYIYIGDVKLYRDTDGIVFEFPEES